MLSLIIILYVLSGKAYLIQSVVADEPTCQVVGAAMAEKLMIDKPDAQIIVAGCAKVEGESVKKESK
jgi:hypothetical protein